MSEFDHLSEWHRWTDGFRVDPPPEGVPFVIKREGNTTLEYIERRADLPPWLNVANLYWRLLHKDGGKIQ